MAQPTAIPAALSWVELEALAAPEADRVEGPTNAQATLRLFGRTEDEVLVTLYRDHHAWCTHQAYASSWLHLGCGH